MPDNDCTRIVGAIQADCWNPDAEEIARRTGLSLEAVRHELRGLVAAGTVTELAPGEIRDEAGNIVCKRPRAGYEAPPPEPMDEAAFDAEVRRFLTAPPEKLADRRLLELAAVARFAQSYVEREMLRRGTATKYEEEEPAYPELRPPSRGSNLKMGCPPLRVVCPDTPEQRSRDIWRQFRGAEFVFNEPEWPDA